MNFTRDEKHEKHIKQQQWQTGGVADTPMPGHQECIGGGYECVCRRALRDCMRGSRVKCNRPGVGSTVVELCGSRALQRVNEGVFRMALANV
jgi:hypothetical protein